MMFDDAKITNGNLIFLPKNERLFNTETHMSNVEDNVIEVPSEDDEDSYDTSVDASEPSYYSEFNLNESPSKSYSSKETKSSTTSKVCAECNTRSTTQWRRGPDSEILCNACGLAVSKRVKKFQFVKRGVNPPKKKKLKVEEIPKNTTPLKSNIKFDISTQTMPEIARLIDVFPQKAELGSIIELFFCWETDIGWFGFLSSVNINEPASSLRNLLVKEGILDSPNFSILYRKAPMSSSQEEQKIIQDCITVVQQNPTIFLRKKE